LPFTLGLQVVVGDVKRDNTVWGENDDKVISSRPAQGFCPPYDDYRVYTCSSYHVPPLEG